MVLNGQTRRRCLLMIVFHLLKYIHLSRPCVPFRTGGKLRWAAIGAPNGLQHVDFGVPRTYLGVPTGHFSGGIGLFFIAVRFEHAAASSSLG